MAFTFRTDFSKRTYRGPSPMVRSDASFLLGYLRQEVLRSVVFVCLFVCSFVRSCVREHVREFVTFVGAAYFSKTAGDKDSVQCSTYRKWHPGYQMVACLITSLDPKPL